MKLQSVLVSLISLALVSLSGCGFWTLDPPDPSFTLGGTVVGLTSGQTVTLVANKSDPLVVAG